MSKTLEPLPPEIEVPRFERQINGGVLKNAMGHDVELTEENFAKLCASVTQLREEVSEKFDVLETAVDDIDRRLAKIESDLDIRAIQNIRGDIQKVARIISTLKTEASDLKPDLESDVPF